MLTKVQAIAVSACIALSLYVLSTSSVCADDGKLTGQKAKQLISELFSKQPDGLEVIGVMEPSQNTAMADVAITNLLVARPKNDAVTAYAFGPGGGTYVWSGRGKANFIHYNDGRWVLTSLDTEVGSFSPNLPTTLAPTAAAAAVGRGSGVAGSTAIPPTQEVASRQVSAAISTMTCALTNNAQSVLTVVINYDNHTVKTPNWGQQIGDLDFASQITDATISWHERLALKSRNGTMSSSDLAMSLDRATGRLTDEYATSAGEKGVSIFQCH